MSLQSAPIPVKKPSVTAPLFEAWQAIRQAREVPWTQEHPEAWRRRFRRAIERAGASLVAHIAQSEGDGEAAERDLTAARDGGEERRSDHSWLRSQLGRVMEELDSIGPPQIGDVVRLSEWLVMLEMRLVMHHNHFHPAAQARGRSLHASGTGVMVGT